jgi:hypothetical protein
VLFVSILISASISECVQNAGVVPSSGALVAAFGEDAGLCFDVETFFSGCWYSVPCSAFKIVSQELCIFISSRIRVGLDFFGS